MPQNKKMPAQKRGRTLARVSRSRSRTRSRSRSLYKSPLYASGIRTWPYARPGMSQMWDPFPSKARAILRYSCPINLSATAGLNDAHLFRANGIQDPDFTGVGHQPYGHDTYLSIYNHYNVVRSTITMQPTGTSECIFGISLCDDSTVQGDYDTVKETKGTVFAVHGAGNPTPKLTKTFDVNQNFDLPYQKATSANFGANPSESMIFHCWAQAKNGSATMSSAAFVITISYIVDMWELKDLGQS